MLVTVWAPDLLAWGPTGHRVTGRIAENHLSPRARKAARALLKGAGLAEASTWADEIRSIDAWRCAAAFHYTSIPDGGSYLETPFARRGDILRALIYFEDVLRDPGETESRKARALKFLIHFIGDLHQPLHVGRSEDRGGNRVRVRWFRTRLDLHHVWDNAVIDFQKLSYTEFARYLDRVSESAVIRLQSRTYLDWANESLALRPRVYRCYLKDGCSCAVKGDCPDGYAYLDRRRGTPPLRYRYNHHAIKIIRARLMEGGVRLAGVLNAVFENRPLTPAARRMRAWVRKKDPAWSRPIRSCFLKASRFSK